jgi:ACS family hexuronate transporter-like MFS transporter
MDKIGVRLGLSLSVAVWSLAAAAHGLARSVYAFGAVRFALGIGEGGNFPASIKTVRNWFPAKERALATGIFNAGSNVGALITPLVVPWLTVHFGWPFAFYVTGALGLIWLAFWLTLYHNPEEHPRLSPRELAYIQSDSAPSSERVP